MTEKGHTPTPWRRNYTLVCTEDGATITSCQALLEATVAGGLSGDDLDEANAAFIVHAVNQHASLVAALEEARGLLERAKELFEMEIDAGDADPFVWLKQTEIFLETDTAIAKAEQVRS
jgi:hypothetical protein